MFKHTQLFPCKHSVFHCVNTFLNLFYYKLNALLFCVNRTKRKGRDKVTSALWCIIERRKGSKIKKNCVTSLMLTPKDWTFVKSHQRRFVWIINTRRYRFRGLGFPRYRDIGSLFITLWIKPLLLKCTSFELELGWRSRRICTSCLSWDIRCSPLIILASISVSESDSFFLQQTQNKLTIIE